MPVSMAGSVDAAPPSMQGKFAATTRAALPPQRQPKALRAIPAILRLPSFDHVSVRRRSQPDSPAAALALFPLGCGRSAVMAAIQAAVRLPQHAAGAAQRSAWRQGAGAPPPAASSRRRCSYVPAASLSIGDPSLLSLPVFPLPNVLHPTQQGVLSGAATADSLRFSGMVVNFHPPSPPPPLPPAVFEPGYLALFRDLLAEHPARGRGGRFVHVLSPQASPPALLEGAVGGLPRIGCCAEVESIQVGAAGHVCLAACWHALLAQHALHATTLHHAPKRGASPCQCPAGTRRWHAGSALLRPPARAAADGGRGGAVHAGGR